MTSHRFEKSSSILSLSYDRAEKVLSITFKSGGTHKFEDVPNDTYDHFCKSESAGKFFHSHIRGKFKEA